MEKRKCNGTTKEGKPCKRWAMRDGDYCHVHGDHYSIPDGDTSIYTDEIRNIKESGWCFVDTAFVKYIMPKVGPNGAAVYLCLCSHAQNNNEGARRPNDQKTTLYEKTIASECGCSVPTVDKYLAILADMNIIHIQTRYVEREKQGKITRRNLASTFSLINKSEWIGLPELYETTNDDQFKLTISKWLYGEYGITNPNNAKIINERSFVDIASCMTQAFFDSDIEAHSPAGLAVSKLLANPFIRESRRLDTMWFQSVETVARQSQNSLEVLREFGCTRYSHILPLEDNTLDVYICTNVSPNSTNCMIDNPISSMIISEFRKKWIPSKTISHWYFTPSSL